MNCLALAAVRQLLRFGEAVASDLEEFEYLSRLRVFRPSKGGRRAMATSSLVRILRS